MAPITTGMIATKGLRGYNMTIGGIIDDPECCDQIVQPFCSNRIDHEVTVIGYGRENNKDYWLGKGSFEKNKKQMGANCRVAFAT